VTGFGLPRHGSRKHDSPLFAFFLCDLNEPILAGVRDASNYLLHQFHGVPMGTEPTLQFFAFPVSDLILRPNEMEEIARHTDPLEPNDERQ
jgi:hypothetical protein